HSYMFIFRSFLHTLTSFVDKIETTRGNYFQKGADVMHTMWKGAISFGLVNIPVMMSDVGETVAMWVRQLHKKCQSTIKNKKTCPVCDEEIKHQHNETPYKQANNKITLLDEEELKALKKEQTDKAVEIIDFVQLEDIDPIYFEKSYYL